MRFSASGSGENKVKVCQYIPPKETFLELESRVKPSHIQDKLDLKKAAHFIYLHYALQRNAHIDLTICHAMILKKMQQWSTFVLGSPFNDGGTINFWYVGLFLTCGDTSNMKYYTSYPVAICLVRLIWTVVGIVAPSKWDWQEIGCSQPPLEDVNAEAIVTGKFRRTAGAESQREDLLENL